jgi:hypothetical protein
MYHIRRDGGWLCGKSKKDWAYALHSHISFSEAHKRNLKGCCKICQQRYYQILENMKDPIVVIDSRKPVLRRKKSNIIIEPGLKKRES